MTPKTTINPMTTPPMMATRFSRSSKDSKDLNFIYDPFGRI
jgi:hypothetical protein